MHQFVILYRNTRTNIVILTKYWYIAQPCDMYNYGIQYEELSSYKSCYAVVQYVGVLSEIVNGLRSLFFYCHWIMLLPRAVCCARG